MIMKGFGRTFAAVMLLNLIATVSVASEPLIEHSTSIAKILNEARNQYPKTPAIAGAVVVDDKIYYAVAGFRRWPKVTSNCESLCGLGPENIADADDRFQQGSISKPITAALIAKAVEKGLLSWETKFIDVFPELDHYVIESTIIPAQTLKIPNFYKDVTLRQFLSHTSGMPYSPAATPSSDYSEINSLSERRYRYVQDSIRDGRQFLPGRGVQYDGGAIIAAAALERRVGRSYEDLVQDWVFAPLAMTHSGFDPMSATSSITGVWEHMWNGVSDPVPINPPADHHGLRSPVGGVTASVVDLARFAHVNLGTAFHKANTIRNLQTTVGLSAYTPGWLVSTKNEAGGIELFHNGSNGWNYSVLHIWPNRKVAILSMTNYCDANPDGSTAYKSDAVDYVAGKLETLLTSLSAMPATSPNFSSPTFKAINVSATSTYQASPTYGAAKAFDGDYSTRWAANAGVTQASLEVKLNTAVDVSGAVINEGLEQPFRATHYKLFVGQSGDMHLASQGDHIGPNLVISFLQTYKNVTTARLEIESTDGPTISEFHLKKALKVIPGP